MITLKPNYYKTKYTGETTFEEMLDKSNELVDRVANYFLKRDFIVRRQDDQHPFMFPKIIRHNGGAKRKVDEIRGVDIFVAKGSSSCFIEVKDFSKLIKIYPPATGIEIKYYERYKKIQREFGIPVALFFIDNEEFENSDKRYEKIIPTKFKDDYIPYGNYINKLTLHDRQNIKNIKGKTQVIFNCSSMITLPEFVNQYPANLFLDNYQFEFDGLSESGIGARDIANYNDQYLLNIPNNN